MRETEARQRAFPVEGSQRLLAVANTADPTDTPGTIADLICRAAARVPKGTAVVSGASSLTWEEVIGRAARIARALQTQGVGPDTLVGLCLDRSADLITGMVGIMLAGGAYVPLLPGEPKARIRQKVADCSIRMVVTDQHGAALLPADVEIARIDDPLLEALPWSPPPSAASADSLAYVLFTSGSTGTPKGVAVTHGNLLHYTQAIAERLGLRLSGETEPWHCATVSTLAADLGHTSVFLALCSGGVLHVLPEELILQAAGFQEWITRHPIDLLKITPSHFQVLAGPSFAPEHLPRRWLVLGGEACPWTLVERVLAAGTCRVLNHYGPTETTVGACAFEPAAGGSAGSPGETVPVGVPLGSATALVVDADELSAPLGAAGELWIGGPGVARGYVAREDLTRERFVTREGRRFYRTGDRVRRLPGGELEFLGRFDSQVKIRGFRVEPGEIEAAAVNHPSVALCAVITPADAAGTVRLIAFVVPRGEPAGLAEVLRTHLEERLPAHMIPGRIIVLPSLPLTPSGKVDRRALSAPELDPQGGGDPEPADTTLEAVIIRIWEEPLPGQAIGPTDDFFTLGGHSLLAVRMVDELAKVIGFHLPLPVLFRGATVRDIARHSVRRVQARVAQEPIEVQAGQSGVTPFFMLHGDYTAGGFYCRWLAEAAGPAQPVYAIPPYSPVDSRPALTIPAMAERHAAAVRRIQPQGPYRLGGYCDGGLVAYELARRLHEEGEVVELVFLVDTVLPNARYRLLFPLIDALCRILHRDPTRRADQQAYLMDRVWDVMRRSPLRRLGHFLGIPSRWVVRRLRAVRGPGKRAATPVAEEAAPPAVPPVVRHFDRARRIYFPGKYEGRIELIQSTDGGPVPTLRDLGWDRVAQEVELTPTTDSHVSIVTTSLPGLFAAVLRRLGHGDGSATGPRHVAEAVRRNG